jgi:molybdopterin synthase catalytic subunit
MDINRMITKLKQHPESAKIGMIATHLGLVRAGSRKGGVVTGIQVAFDHARIGSIMEDTRKLKGIVEVLVDTNEGRLRVGDEIMAVAVAGDIRENVFPALMQTVDRLKAEASGKKEMFE